LAFNKNFIKKEGITKGYRKNEEERIEREEKKLHEEACVAYGEVCAAYKKNLKEKVFIMNAQEHFNHSAYSSRSHGYYKKGKFYLQAGDFEKYVEFIGYEINDLKIAVEREPTNDDEIKLLELNKKSLESTVKELESRKKVYEYSKNL